MVSLKAIAVAYAAANLLAVDASPCRPSSSALSGSETQTLSSVLSASTSGSSAIPVDTTTSKELTLPDDGTTSGSPTSSGSETLSVSVPLSEPTTSDTATLSTIATSSDATSSADLTTSVGSTISAETTASTGTIESTGTTTIADTTATTDTATATDTTTAAETTTSTDATATASTETSPSTDTTATTDTATTADTTTAPDTTTTMASTTTSEEPTTTTSACVEPTNMLREAGFETSTGAWGFYWGGGYVDENAEKPRTGSGAAVLPVPGGQERRMEQRVHVVPGMEYTVSFYYALSAVPDANTQCIVFATFDYYTTLKTVAIPSDTDYHRYTASLIAADNLDPVIEIGVSCSRVNNAPEVRVFVDDTSVMGAACDSTTPTSTLLVPAQPGPANCPVNVAKVPGFEPVGGEQGWAFYNLGEFVEDESNARTGTWEARLPSEPQPNDATFLEQRFSSQQLVAGETYDFRFFWKPETLPTTGQCNIYGGYNDEISFGVDRVNFGATSSTGYTIYSRRFIMPAGNLLLQIVFQCTSSNGQQLQGSVFVDDTALIKVGGCEAYPETGAIIENPSFEVQATDDSTYAWFGTSGVSIKAGTTANGPSPQTGNNFLYIELDSNRKSATVTKPLASTLSPGTQYTISFSWTAGAAYTTSDCSFTVTLGSATNTLNLNSEVRPYEYQAYTASLTPNEATSSMTLEVKCSNVFPDFAFDDFTLQ